VETVFCGRGMRTKPGRQAKAQRKSGPRERTVEVDLLAKRTGVPWRWRGRAMRKEERGSTESQENSQDEEGGEADEIWKGRKFAAGAAAIWW
jgi:hypothetical protein